MIIDEGIKIILTVSQSFVGHFYDLKLSFKLKCRATIPGEYLKNLDMQFGHIDANANVNANASVSVSTDDPAPVAAATT